MKTLEKYIKRRYALFIFTFIVIILAAILIIKNSIDAQHSDAYLINTCGKQRTISQRVAKLAYKIGSAEQTEQRDIAHNELGDLISEWVHIHQYLDSVNNGKHDVIDSLLHVNKEYQHVMIIASQDLMQAETKEAIDKNIAIISRAEGPYLSNTELLVQEYQKLAESNLVNLKNITYILAIIALLILLGEYLFILVPALHQLLQRGNALVASNKELAISEQKLKTNMAELQKLKVDLETRETFNKAFIEQIPAAIAMLDNDLRYIAVSKTWIKDYKLEGREVIGRTHYEVFPEIGEDWREKNRQCLKGAIDICDEAPFIRKDGTTQWISWDTRPWYKADGSIGGLVMHTSDISEFKFNESQRKQVERILHETNEVARIGTWEVDLVSSQSYLSEVVREIHGISKDYEISVDNGVLSYKEGESREKIQNAFLEAIDYGKPYDLELELINANGDVVWVRSIGQVERVNGKTVKVYGLLQDINNFKLAQLELKKVNTQLKAIFNSKAVAMVTTDLDGVINRFNPGAEILTGYTAEEMVGKERPNLYLLKEECINFVTDIAKHYNKKEEGFNAQYELAKHNRYDTREWTYKRKDGKLLPVQLTLTSIKDEENSLIGYLGVSTDISEKKAAENKLLHNNQLLNYAEELTAMGNWKWDTVNDQVEWSKNLYNVFKLNPDTKNLSFNTYFNFVHPEDKEKVTVYFRITKEEKHLKSFTHRIIDGEGNLKIIQLLGEVITDASGEVVEMIGTCQDVTDQKLVEIELLRKNYILNFAERITQMGNWQWDVASDTLKWSSNLYRIFEYDENITDLNYDTFFSHVHPEDKDYIADFVEKSFKEKQFSSKFIHRIITSKGNVKTVHFLGEVILNEQGEVVEMMGACQDITEQKMEENKFRGLLESAPDAMVIFNEHGVIQLINKQSEKLFGYAASELVEQPVEILIPYQFNDDNSSYHDGFFVGPSVDTMGVGNAQELFATHKNGNEIPVQISFSPLETEEGVLVSAAIRDITVQKLAQSKIIAAKNDLEDLTERLIVRNNQLADFAQITSHNLRAPVSNLNALLTFYLESNDEDEKRFLFKKFESVINHLTLTLNTLVEAIKIRNSVGKKQENIKFDDVLTKTKEILSAEILETAAQITANFSEIPEIRYYKIYLESIFLNLLDNAIKYRAKDRPPEITVKSMTFKGRTKLVISDNGLGINLERHGEKIFGLNKVFHRHPEAKGLGLYMTKTQVEAMGGEISVTSTVNEGSTFTIIF